MFRSLSILEVVLYVDDLDEAEEFYGGVLGLELFSRHPTRQAFFRCGDLVLLLFRSEETVLPPPSLDLPVPTHGSRGQGHICFGVETSEEVQTWRDHLSSNDIAIEADFKWPNGARSVYVRDPSGNSVEIAERWLWGRDRSN